MFDRMKSLISPKDKAPVPSPGTSNPFMSVSYQTPPVRGTKELLDLYSESPWLRAVVNKISRAVADTDWRLFVSKNGGAASQDNIMQKGSFERRRQVLKTNIDLNAVVEITDHPLLDFLDIGNEDMIGHQAMQVTQTYFDIVGEAYWVLDLNGLGTPVAYWPVPPHWMRQLPTKNDPHYELSTGGGKYMKIPKDRVIQFKDPNPANPYARGSGIGMSLGDELEIDEYACHDSQTECLTKRGWVPWSEIKKDDLLGTLNPENDSLEYQKPIKVFDYDYDGEMHHWNGARSDLLITPNHNMWVYAGYGRGNCKNSPRGKEWHLETSKDASKRKSKRVFDWRETGGSFDGKTALLTIPAVKQELTGRPPKFGVDDELVFEVESFAPFLGYFISEGSYGRASVHIGQTGGPERKELIIENIESSFGIFDDEWVTKKHDKNDPRAITWGIFHKGLKTWLVENVGKGSENKKIPECVFDWGAPAQEALLIALMEGDGVIYEISNDFSSGSYGSISESLIDDIQRVCMQIGWSARKIESNPTSKNRYFILQIRRRKTRVIDSDSFKSVSYKGKVWCAEVPNGLLITRRNGCPVVSGNSKHMKSFFYNRARPDLIISGDNIGEADAKRLEESWVRKFGGFMRAYRPAFFSKKVDVKEVTQTFESMQLVPMRKHERDTFINVYGVPPEKLGVIGESKRSTISAADFFWSKDVIRPRAEILRRTMQAKLVPLFDRRLILDYHSPVVQDEEFELKVMTQAQHAFTLNEWRRKAGLEDLPGDVGESVMVPLNSDIRPVADLQDNPEEEPEEAPEEDEDEETPEEDEEAVEESEKEFKLRVATHLGELTPEIEDEIDKLVKSFERT